MCFFTELYSESTFILVPEFSHISKIQMLIPESECKQKNKKTTIPYM